MDALRRQALGPAGQRQQPGLGQRAANHRRVAHARPGLGRAASPAVCRRTPDQHHGRDGTGSWPLYRFGYQFTGSEALDEAYVPFFGAFGAAWDDAMVARWSANPLGMLWPEMDAAVVAAAVVEVVHRPRRGGRW